MSRKRKIEDIDLNTYFRDNPNPSLKDIMAKFAVSYATAWKILHNKGAYSNRNPQLELPF